jgi:hypothetical protein
MVCENPTWLIYLTRFVLVVCGILVIVLMQKAEHDKSILRVDSPTLMKARRLSFWAIALFGVVPVLLTDGNPIAQLMLYISTGAVLVVDIIALVRRPPATGLSTADTVARWPIRRITALFRRVH